MNRRRISGLLLVVFLFQLFAPTLVYALSEGPTAPERSGFTSVSTNGLVNTFTGGFNYGIPLMDVDGYPLTLKYNSGITMEQEASWVGLGWSLSVGEINRSLRGIPDDVNGESISKLTKIRDNTTAGVNVSGINEIFGRGKIKVSRKANVGTSFNSSIGIFKNSYKGWGFSLDAGFSANAGLQLGPKETSAIDASFETNISLNTQEGLSANPTFCLSQAINSSSGAESAQLSVGSSYNTREGLEDLNFGCSLAKRYSANYSVSKSDNFSLPENMMNSENYSVLFKMGPEFTGFNPSITLSGFYTKSSIANKQYTRNVYGYLYDQNADQDHLFARDYISYNKGGSLISKPDLPLPVATFDLFSASADGLNMQFRAHRGDLQVFSESYATGGGVSGNVNVELGISPNIGKVGLNVQAMLNNSDRTKWIESNSYRTYASPRTKDANHPTYEQAFFAAIGESTAADHYYDEHTGGNTASKICLTQSNRFATAYAENSLSVYDANTASFGKQILGGGHFQRERRLPRTSMIGYETQGQLALLAGSHEIKNYTLFSTASVLQIDGTTGLLNNTTTSIPRTQYNADHIGKITVTDPNGKRYVFGQPTYSRNQVNVSFSVNSVPSSQPGGAGTLTEQDRMMVRYTDTEASLSNNSGLDNFYNEDRTPDYATSFLLTEIHSDDYVDRTQDGPTIDDNGQWYKFNYSMAASNYRWRVPSTNLEKLASYLPGVKNKAGDDKATFSYGEKELWYLNSVESKDYVAVFVMSNRNDNLQALGRDGGIDTATSERSKKLDEIRLFSKNDIRQNGAAATPIKTVHFTYDYQLCPYLPNSINQGGKLTLKSVYFTYGNNIRGTVLSPYQFSYRSESSVFTYNNMNADRWGYFRGGVAGLPSTKDFIYTPQNKASQDDWSSAWNLSTIQLPSGGKIEVSYESNDYAYVQDKPVQNMFQVEGFSRTDNYADANADMFDGSGAKLFMFVKVPDNYSEPNPSSLYNGLDNLYYQIAAKPKSSLPPEILSGYLKIKSKKVVTYPSGTNHICIEFASTGKNNSNPIAKTGWQFMRNELPDVMHPGSTNTSGDILQLLKSIVSVAGELKVLFTGFDKYCSDKDWFRTIDPSKSFVRLNSSHQMKLGGGCRVKQISLTDNWSEVAPSVQRNSIKIYKYAYTTSQGTGYNSGNLVYMSSGVAENEPEVGGEENSLKGPKMYSERQSMSRSDNSFETLPYCSSLYPSASIGYSEVTVKQFYQYVANEGQIGPVASALSGTEVFKYYTAHDFPTREIITGNKETLRESPDQVVFSFLKYLSINRKAFSQGFYVETNDMHGKLKEHLVLNEQGSEIAKERYLYQVNSNGQLDNNVDVLHANTNVVQKKEIGISYDAWSEMNEYNNVTHNAGIQANADGFNAFLFIVIPSFLPSYKYTEIRYRYASHVKLVNRSGLLKETQTYKNGVLIKSLRNDVFDELTGQPVIVSELREGGNRDYTYSLPANWFEGNLGPVYQHENDVVELTALANGQATSILSLPMHSLLHNGDILVPEDYFSKSTLKSGTANKVVNRLWYYAEDDNVDGYLIDDQGDLVSMIGTSNIRLRVTKCGHKNHLNSTSYTLTTDVPTMTQLLSNERWNVLNLNCNKYNSVWKLNNAQQYTSWTTEVQDNSQSSLESLRDFIKGLYLSNSGRTILVQNNNAPYFKYQDTPRRRVKIDPKKVEDIIKIFRGANAATPFFPVILGLSTDQSNFITEVPPGRKNDLTYSPVVNMHFGPNYRVEFRRIDGPELGISDFGFLDLSVPGNVTILNSATDSYVRFKINKGGSAIGIYEARLFKIVENSSCDDYTAQWKGNPLLLGLMNNPKKSAELVFYADRKPFSAVNSNFKNRGYYEVNPVPFKFESTTNHWAHSSTSSDKYLSKSQAMRIDQYSGMVIQEVDANNIRSALNLGYYDPKVSIVAANSKNHELYFNGFEEPLSPSIRLCPVKKWKREPLFFSDPGFEIINTLSHSGRHSLKIDAGATLDFEFLQSQYNTDNDLSQMGDYFTLDPSRGVEIKPTSVMPTIYLEKNKKYSLRFWRHIPSNCSPTVIGSLGRVSIYDGSALSFDVDIVPAGRPIDGWVPYQALIDLTGTIGGSSNYLSGHVLIGSVSDVVIDDIRLSPINSAPKSFVYDFVRGRVMASTDANNYCIYYEYDDAGNRIRTKRETERGVMTVNENRISNHLK